MSQPSSRGPVLRAIVGVWNGMNFVRRLILNLLFLFILLLVLAVMVGGGRGLRPLDARTTLVFAPEAVLVETLDNKWKPALCYIAPAMEPRPAENDYIDRIVGPAKEYGFPDWYIRRLESFRPNTPQPAG